MKRLILFRHGKTERHAPSGEDFDRRLTVRGCEDSHLMGKVLAEAGLVPNLALVLHRRPGAGELGRSQGRLSERSRRIFGQSFTTPTPATSSATPRPPPPPTP